MAATSHQPVSSEVGRHRGRALAAVVLALAALALILLAAVIAAHGRIDVTIAGRHRAIRRVVPLSFAAWVFGVAAMTCLLPAVRERILSRIESGLCRFAGLLAGLAAAAVGTVAVVRGAFVAAGSDPYGYVTQAALWTRGNPLQPLAAIARGAPTQAYAFCPLGYRPGLAPETMAPVYAPGLPLQMAALERIFGVSAGYLAVPVLSAVTVWLTFAIGRRCTSRGAALLATAVMATSPVFLFQAMQPLSDVPATAWWLASIACALGGTVPAAAAAGLCASVAILVRPNLVPLVLPLCLFVAVAARSRASGVFVFLVGCGPGIALVAAANAVLYGSPAASGYGDLSALFAVRGALGTTLQYVIWFWDTHSVFPWLALAAPVMAVAGRLRASEAAFSAGALAFSAALLACYAFYVRFDHWSFLRFLLPAIPLLLLTASIVVAALLQNANRSARAAVFALVVALVPFAYVHTAAKGDAFRVKGQWTARTRGAARFVADRLPVNAVYLSLAASGSLREYGDRMTVRYEAVAPEEMDPLVVYLEKQGLVPYAALERTEVVPFVARFHGSDAARRVEAREAALMFDEAGMMFVPLTSGTGK